jgi:GGDEF domain-containing protein
MHLVLIETSGNQDYIFASNRMRENVGASELTYRVGTEYVLRAVAEAGGPQLWQDDAPPKKLREALQDKGQNPALETGRHKIEVVLAASGKGLVAVADEETGRAIVAAVTSQALREAPGLDVRGVVSRGFDLASRPMHDVVREVHQQLESLRARLPGPSQRFLRLPVVDQCVTSGLPASVWEKPASDQPLEACSRVSRSKRQMAENGLRRMRDATASVMARLDANLPYSADKLEREMGCEWLAVVHADGNGLGNVFLQFHKYVRPSFEQGAAAHNRAYLDMLRRFSLALDECTEAAFCKALRHMHARRGRGRNGGRHASRVLPILPLVLGGDDLTVLCDGQQAMAFTKRFLEAFASEARRSVIHKTLTQGGDRGLTASAGIAIVKPHFPFFAAYELSAALLQSAKRAKPRPAIDWHVVLDASSPDLERTRSRLRVDGGQTCLTARPYLVDENGTAAADGGFRCLAELEKKIRVIRGDDKSRIPRSVLHDLRQALFLGHAQADARLALMRPRHALLDKLAADGTNSSSLFYGTSGGQGASAGQPARYTCFLDALELASFWEVSP